MYRQHQQPYCRLQLPNVHVHAHVHFPPVMYCYMGTSRSEDVPPPCLSQPSTNAIPIASHSPCTPHAGAL
eukprot:7384237-Prymnesium_polylepis.1